MKQTAKAGGALEKAFQVLEHLSREPERWLPLTEVADGLGLNRATCVHILGKLVAMGYAEQSGPRGGYRLGPMTYHLTRHGTYRRGLVAAAEPVMAKLVRAVDETTALIALEHGRRLRLCRIQGGGELQVDEGTEADRIVYMTASGRLLLAHAVPHELELFVAANGLPKEKWPEARTWPALKKTLTAIRARPEPLVFVRAEVTGLSSTIRRDGQVVAALALHLPTFRFKGRHKQEILQQLPAAAAAISSALANASNGR